jgi:hypothetical protein
LLVRSSATSQSGATLIGYPITLPTALGIAAIMAVIIYVLADGISDKFADQAGAAMSLGCFGSIIVVLLGLPGWMFLVYLNGGELTGWAIIPCGIVTAFLVWMWMNRKDRKSPEEAIGRANSLSSGPNGLTYKLPFVVSFLPKIK